MKKINNKQPLISVLLPVYNPGGFLTPAIKSILDQTYKNFELILINDASTDGSTGIIKKFAKKNSRIKIITNSNNLGLARSLIKGLKIAKGDYIARMDADDIAVKNRFRKQIEYLEKNEDIVAVGGQCILIDSKGRVTGKKNLPTSSKEIYNYMFRFNPIQHPTLMIKKKNLPANFEFYKQKLEGAEDLDLIFKLMQYGKVENMKDYLIKYRIHGNNMSLKNVKGIFMQAFMTRMKALFNYHYRPTILGLITTLIEAVVVLLLPQKILLWAYLKLRTKSSIKTSFKTIKKVALRLQPAV